MSFATALGSYLGARNRSKNQANEYASDQAYRQDELAERRRTDDASIETQRAEQARLTAQEAAAEKARIAALHAQGFDENGSPLPLAPLPANLTQISPHNKGQVLQPLQQAQATIAHFQDLASFYATRSPAAAQFYQQQARDAALNVGTLATAAYTSGARTDLAEAQTKNIASLDARARDIAKGHDAASVQRATAEASSRMELARYNGAERQALARLTGAYHLQGISWEAASRQAIDKYNQGMSNYRSAQFDQQFNPATVLPPQPVYQPPVFNINVPGAGGGAPAFPGGAPPGPNPPDGGAGGLSPQAQNVLTGAQAALKRGASMHDVLDALQKNAGAAGLMPQDVSAIRATLSGGLKPLPVGGMRGALAPVRPTGGGSTAIDPFPLAH